MKSIIILAIISISFCNILKNQYFYNKLKKIAPYKIYSPEENPFRDWTNEEIRKLLKERTLKQIIRYKKVDIEINEGYDFRKAHPDCVYPVYNQNRCGASWVFAGITAMQQRFCFQSKGKVNPRLSPQDPLSCDENSQGCRGGMINFFWNYIKEKGCVDENCLPFTSGSGYVEECPNKCKNGAEWKKYFSKQTNTFEDAESIKKEILTNGPVVSIFKVYEDFMYYMSGIYEHRMGKLHGAHAVVILGFGEEYGIKYWICQNSWGRMWGEGGYFRIKMGDCGIDSYATAGEPIL